MGKNRDIPITEYLDILQKEFLVAEIRHKIYPKISDKTFWGKVMEGKKRKIEDICHRNRIENIFNSETEKRRICDLIYNQVGLPNFLYKDENQRIGNGDFPGLEETDIANYYSLNSEVRVDFDGERLFGKITDFDFDRTTIEIKTEKGIFDCHRKTVTRIL